MSDRPLPDLHADMRSLSAAAAVQLVPRLLHDALTADDPEIRRKVYDSLAKTSGAAMTEKAQTAQPTFNIVFNGTGFTASVEPTEVIETAPPDNDDQEEELPALPPPTEITDEDFVQQMNELLGSGFATQGPPPEPAK